MIGTILNWAQLVLGILLMIAILIQAKGTGLGAAFGGGDNVYRTKRGVKKLFHATIIAVLFFGVSLPMSSSNT